MIGGRMGQFVDKMRVLRQCFNNIIDDKGDHREDNNEHVWEVREGHREVEAVGRPLQRQLPPTEHCPQPRLLQFAGLANLTRLQLHRHAHPTGPSSLIQASLSKLSSVPVECVLDNIFVICQFREAQAIGDSAAARRARLLREVGEAFESALRKVK